MEKLKIYRKFYLVKKDKWLTILKRLEIIQEIKI